MTPERAIDDKQDLKARVEAMVDRGIAALVKDSRSLIKRSGGDAAIFSGAGVAVLLATIGRNVKPILSLSASWVKALNY